MTKFRRFLTNCQSRESGVERMRNPDHGRFTLLETSVKLKLMLVMLIAVLAAAADKSASHLAVANTLAKQNNWNGAVAEYRRALQFNPNSAAAHHDLGVALAATGNSAWASDEYRAAVALDPANPTFHADLAFGLAARGD